MPRTLDDFIAELPEKEQHAIQQETERLLAEAMPLRAQSGHREDIDPSP